VAAYRGAVVFDDPFLHAAVGDTPLVRLTRVVPEGCGEVWLKLESGNPTGSYKDRMAVSVIRGALERGEVAPGDRVVEYTGGSTGTALAFACARAGLRFTAVSSDAFSEVKLRSMRAYGAEVIVERSDDGRITPELIARMRDHALALGEEPGTFYADQFGSPDVRAGYVPMGQEIAGQTGGRVDVLCAGVGTGAALMGTVDGLDALGVPCEVYALEPAQSPLLTTGVGGPHRVEGIGVGFEPPFLDRDRCREIRTVDEADAMAMARRLAIEEGLLCGTSTGLNVCAAVELAAEVGQDGLVVTLGCDSGTKYLGGDLFAVDSA
jgi:cysteine synthase A